MNLCRVYPVFIMLCIAISGAIAHVSGAPLLHVIILGLAVGMAPLVLMGIMSILMVAWCPDRPMCRCGKCRSDDYSYVESGNITVETVFEYQCPFCSRTYRQRDKRFWEFSSDGSEIPYAVISKWGRWKIEDTEPPVAAEGDIPHC
jgi:hypothetical protein